MADDRREMTKVQMIVTENGKVINFDAVEALAVCEELAPDHEHTVFRIMAKLQGIDRTYRIKEFNDKETAQTCLMSKLKRAKRTDGIARFDSDIWQDLHEKG